MKKSLLSLGLLSTAMGVYVNDQSGDVGIGGTVVEGIYGAGSIIKHSTEKGVFEVQVTDAALVDDNDPANKINTNLKLNAKLALGDGASDASKRVLSTKSISYWSGKCADVADLNTPEGSIALGADFAVNDVTLSYKRNIEGSTTNDDDKKLFGCLRLNNPDDGSVKHYGDLHVEVNIGIASKVLSTDYANEAITDNDFDYEGSGSTDITLSEEWSLIVDEDTTFAGDDMENNGSNNGIDAQSLGADSNGSDQEMDVKVPISSAHGLKVPDVSITHADFVSGDLRGATATMSIDDSKYAAFRGTKLETAAVTCTTGVTSPPELSVTCTVSGGADFKLPYDHVKQSYVSAAGCDSGLCGGKIEIVASGSGSGGLQGPWYGAGISAWATSDFDCAHPAFTPVTPIAKDFFDSAQKDLSDILTAGTEKRVCELDDTLTFVKPSDNDSLVSGCDGGAQVVGDAASIDAGLNFISNKYGQCKVAEPDVFTDDVQIGEVIGIQASCSDGVSADETACSAASGTWRAAVTSGDLFRNTQRLNYVYGVSDISLDANMKTSYTSSTSTFLQTQTTRTCTASTSTNNNLVASKQTDFETAKTNFENSGTLDFTLAAGDVEFDEDTTNTKTQGDENKKLRARCSAETAQVSLTCDLDDKTDISDPQLGFTASATVEAPQTSVTVSYDLLKDDESQSNSGVATTDVNNDAKNGDDRSTAVYKKSISYTGFDGLKTYQIALTSNKNGDYAFNCGNGGDLETYTGSTDLPCDGAQALEHEVTTWVRYTDDDLKVTPAFASGKESIKESTGYGELATKTIAGALEFSSTAITNDISVSTLTGSADNEFSAGVSSTEPATVAGTMLFAANNCQYATDKIVCDLVITGSRDNIYGGADEDHALLFAPKYQHHKTGAACESNTKAPLADSGVNSNNGLTFKFEKEVDLYRGGVKVRDNDNYATQGINTNRAGWTAIDPGGQEDHITEAEIINYAIKMDVAGVVLKPEISFDVLSDGASSNCDAADRKLFFDPLKLEFIPSASTTYPDLEDSTPVAISGCSGAGDQARYQFESDCLAGGGVWSSTDYHTVTVKSGANTLKPKLRPVAAYNDDGVQAGDSMVQFGVYVQQCGDVTRRKIVLNIQSALADSTPAVGVAVTADFDKQSSYLLNSVSTDQNSPTEITDLANAYTKWNEVTLFFQHFQDGETDTVQGDKNFELVNSLCPHDKFTADDHVYTIGTTQPTGIKFTKSNQCTTVGRIGFSFDGQCYYVKIPCKRHATTSDLDLSLSLNYGVTYSTTQLSVTTDTDKTVDLGAGASCSSNGVVTHATGSCTGIATSIASDFTQVLNTFKECGTDTLDGDQTTWTMNLVQGITKNSQEFCNARPLSLAVIHKGRNSAKISILGLPELDIQLALTNLAYEDCTDGQGASGHQVVFKIVDATTGTVITAENSKINGDVTQSQFDLTSGTDTSYTGTCQNYCGTAQTVVAFDFDAKGSVSNQDFYADVSGDLTLTGDPCTGSQSETFTAQLQSAALGSDASCQDSTSYDSSTSQVATDGTGCFKLSPNTIDYAGVFAPVSTSVKSGPQGGALVADASITVSNPDQVGTDFYYSISDLLSLSGKEVELTVEWQYSIGSRRLRTTTTYLLGSSDHHSSAGIKILPAGVQVQEQIEAAGASQQAPPASQNVAPASQEASMDSQPLWGIILGVGGSVLAVVAIVLAVRKTERRADGGPGGKKGYQRVGRFQSNLAF